MHVAACMAIASKGKTTRKHRTYVPFHVMYWYKPPRRAVSSDGALRLRRQILCVPLLCMGACASSSRLAAPDEVEAPEPVSTVDIDAPKLWRKALMSVKAANAFHAAGKQAAQQRQAELCRENSARQNAIASERRRGLKRAVHSIPDTIGQLYVALDIRRISRRSSRA